MNKEQKEVIGIQLENEKKIINELKKTYEQAEKDIDEKIQMLMTDELTQSKIYQIEYQKALKGQIDTILDKMNSDNYETIHEYIKNCYEDSFIGTMYDLQAQGIPLIVPIDQELVVKAIQLDSKVSGSLYEAMGVNVKDLKKSIRSEISRGISQGFAYQDMARNINNTMKIGLNKSIRIARTEGHRVNQESTFDGMTKAKEKGADVVKQWDSTLDGKTRPTHRQLDGQLRELNEPFEVAGHKAKYPGGFGIASEDVNCRCCILQRARWALDEDELQTLKNRAAYFGLDKSDNFDDYKRKYLEINDNVGYNDIKQTKLVNTKRSGSLPPPMDANRYKTMVQGLKKSGITVIEAKDDDLRFLQFLGAEATIGGDNYIYHMGEIPSASAFFEEIIHITQARIYGILDSTDGYELCVREILANRRLFKNSKAYGFTDEDYEDIKHNLGIWESRFKELTGVDFDESGINRKI